LKIIHFQSGDLKKQKQWPAASLTDDGDFGLILETTEFVGAPELGLLDAGKPSPVLASPPTDHRRIG